MTISTEATKLLALERPSQKYMSPALLPEEYIKLQIPYAGIYFRQDDDCDILSQHISLGPFSLWLHDAMAKKDIVLYPFTPYPLWALHYMHEDSLQPDLYKESNFSLEENECNLFYLDCGLHRIPMPAGKKILSVHINILPADLTSLTARYPLLQPLAVKNTPHQFGSINNYPQHINAVCDLLLRQIVTCQLTGTRAFYFLRRCCMDLFINFAQQHSMTNERLLFTSLLNATAYHSLFKHLVKFPHRSHNLQELAYHYDIPANELVQGFRQYFSTSPEDLIYMLRMMKAYRSGKRMPELEKQAAAYYEY